MYKRRRSYTSVSILNCVSTLLGSDRYIRGSLMRSVYSYFDNVNLLKGVILLSFRALRAYRGSYRGHFHRALNLVKSHHFKPEEAWQFGLMDPTTSDSMVSGYVSKQALSRAQNRLNPLDWYYMTEDKSIFYRICQQLDIPAPEMYGISYNRFPSWTADSSSPSRLAQWESILKDIPHRGFVIKPSRSLFGRGVNVYSFRNDTLVDSNQCEVSYGQIAEKVLNEKDYDCLIIQERLKNHIAFSSVGNSDYLQTLRVITFVDEEGKSHILASFLKLIRGQNSTDNWDGGKSGNLILCLDNETGNPEGVIFGDSILDTSKYVTWASYCRNTSGIDAGFTVPQWDDVTELAHKLAHTFLPLRTIGWDIAVCDNGVKVLEGNYRAGPYPFPSLREKLSPLFAASEAFTASKRSP